MYVGMATKGFSATRLSSLTRAVVGHLSPSGGCKLANRAVKNTVTLEPPLC